MLTCLGQTRTSYIIPRCFCRHSWLTQARMQRLDAPAKTPLQADPLHPLPNLVPYISSVPLQRASGVGSTSHDALLSLSPTPWLLVLRCADVLNVFHISCKIRIFSQSTNKNHLGSTHTKYKHAPLVLLFTQLAYFSTTRGMQLDADSPESVHAHR